MPEVLPRVDDADNPVSPPAPRSALFWTGTHWRVPRVDDHGRVQVRGEDQLFSFKGVLALSEAGAISGANGYFESDPVPAGEIWHVSHVYAIDITSPTTRHVYLLNHDGTPIHFHADVQAFGAGASSDQFCSVFMDPSDVIRVEFAGSQVDDAIRIRLVGYRMTLET